jgi:hypothetical protein
MPRFADEFVDRPVLLTALDVAYLQGHHLRAAQASA